ncbi:unnamed protein product [Choristocarpus tenellus]
MGLLGIIWGRIKHVFGVKQERTNMDKNTEWRKGRRRTLKRIKTHINSFERSLIFTAKRKEFLDKAHKKRVLLARFRTLQNLRRKGKFVKSAVRELYPEVQGAIFDLLFDEFECYGAEDNCLAMFTLATFLTTTETASFCDEVDLGFSVFDVDGSGDISRAEFGMLVKASTTASNFKFRNNLDTARGREHFLKLCKHETAPVVVEAFDAVKRFKGTKNNCTDEALNIFETYFKDGAHKQLEGLSTDASLKMGDELQQAVAGKMPIQWNFFDKALVEVLGHLEKECFVRFKENSLEFLNKTNQLFDMVDADGSGAIVLEEYMAWAKENQDCIEGMFDFPHTSETRVQPFDR